MLPERRAARLTLLLGGVVVGILLLAFTLNWPRLMAWYEFRRQFEPLGRNVQGYPEYRHEESGIVFVSLPGGKFRMGSPAPEAKPPSDRTRWIRDDEGPVHTVTLSPFLIAKHEVTQAQWKRVMGTNPSHFEGDDLPVEEVSWESSQKFCAGTGLSLPTEAQWEYACRAGQTGPYSGSGELDDMGWYDANSGDTSHPVGSKAPNQFGLHDMHGNVCEWCEDIHDDDFYGSDAAGGPDPVVTAESGDRVYRGGCWFDGAWDCRSACRSSRHPSFDNYSFFGFRPSNFGFRPIKRLP